MLRMQLTCDLLASARRAIDVVKRSVSPDPDQGDPKRQRQDAPAAATQEAPPAEYGESLCYLCEVRRRVAQPRPLAAPEFAYFCLAAGGCARQV